MYMTLLFDIFNDTYVLYKSCIGFSLYRIVHVQLVQDGKVKCTLHYSCATNYELLTIDYHVNTNLEYM